MMEAAPMVNSLVQSAFLSIIESTDTVFIKRPVRELLFQGFSQPSMGKIQKTMDTRNFPPFLHKDKFGFFYPVS